MRGFTLIELMVAVGIIAIISVAGIYTSAAVLTSNRNTQRVSDLKLIQVALEHYYTDRGYYPCSSEAGCSNRLDLSVSKSITNCTGRAADEICSVSSVYLSAIPSDPRKSADTTLGYCYDAQISRDNTDHSCNNSSDKTQCRYYHLYAIMEGGDSTTVTCQNGNIANNKPNYVVEPL